MFYWILSIIFESYAFILWKKALSFNCPNTLFRLFWLTFWVIFSIIFLVFWYSDFSWLTWSLFGMIIWITLLSYVRIYIGQYVYQREKISVLAPYENINKIISIIFAFIIFWDVSVISFIITLLAWIILILFSIDFKTLKIPRLIKLFSINQLIISLTTVSIWYFLTQITALDYYIIYCLFFTLIILPIVIYRKEHLEAKNLSKSFYINRMWDSFISDIWTIIMFFVIMDLWLTISILFSYLYVWVLLLMSYFLLNDKPTKKNIILTIILSLMVWLGYYLR